MGSQVGSALGAFFQHTGLGNVQQTRTHDSTAPLVQNGANHLGLRSILHPAPAGAGCMQVLGAKHASDPEYKKVKRHGMIDCFARCLATT